MDETNDLFGRGPPAEEIIKMDDSSSQHEFRYYNGIRQRYCSSFKGNGFNVPDRIGFSCEESESTIVNPKDDLEANEHSDSDEHTLQSESGNNLKLITSLDLGWLGFPIVDTKMFATLITVCCLVFWFYF